MDGSKKYNEIQKKIDESSALLGHLATVSYDSIDDWKNSSKEVDQIRYNLSNKFSAYFDEQTVRGLDEILYSDKDFDFVYFIQTLTDGERVLKDKVDTTLSALDKLTTLIKLSDFIMLGKSFKDDRAQLTVDQKQELLLQKLYLLRKTNDLWSAELILRLNQVEIDDDDEVVGLIDRMKKQGVVYTDGNYSSRFVKISVKGKTMIEKIKKTAMLKPEIKKSSTLLDIFISHSSEDAEIAKLIIAVIKSALNLPSNRIRCSSVDGYRLPTGATTDEQLKVEVNDCKVLIGVISQNSMSSAYVMFELGARWGQSKPLFPIVIGATGVELLKGPLAGINGVNSSNTSQVYQFIEDLAAQLSVKCEPASVYAHFVNDLVDHTLNAILPPEVREVASKKSGRNSPVTSTSQMIKDFCEVEWPDDFKMQLHCMEQQEDAVKKLETIDVQNIPEAVVKLIFDKSINDWPRDFHMQLHSRLEQIDAYKKLNRKDK